MIALLLALGCGGGPAEPVIEPPVPEPAPPPAADPCEGVLEPRIWPRGEASIRDPVVVSFSDPVTGDGTWPIPGDLPTIRVAAGDQVVQGSVRQQVGAGWTDAFLVFVPKQPLQPDTAYAVEVNSPCGSAKESFRTTVAGGPVELPNEVYFEVDRSGGWPATRLNKLFPRWIRLAIRGEGLAAMAGTEPCVGTEMSVSGEAFVDLEAAALPAPDLFEGVVIRNARLQGVLRPDGSAIDGLRLRGELDARVQPEACSVLEVFGFGCRPCSDGGGAFCLQLDLLGGRAVRTDDPSPESCAGTP